MRDKRIFASYRYFLVPCNQLTLFSNSSNNREEAVKSFFQELETNKKIPFEQGGRKLILVLERKIETHVFVCKFAVEKSETRHYEAQTDIMNVIEPDFPYIYLIIDVMRQLILIEVNTSVFSSVSGAKGKVQFFLGQQFMPNGFEVLLEEIVDKNTFWNYVEKCTGIYDVSVTLNSPNLFGGFFEVEKMLHEIQQLYNNTQTTMRVSNGDGKLSGISRGNPALESSIRYAAAGAGEWTLTGEVNQRRQTFKSKHKIKKVNLVPIPQVDEESCIKKVDDDIIQAFNSLEDVLPKVEADEADN